ncbi:MAG TPA: [FeFe] hydrogenase H-cluster radical SAM maturase HydG [bacterium]|nr:[FeFe] hydrogenase H-cluster radical SAM maturase HydG [bacterium]
MQAVVGWKQAKVEKIFRFLENNRRRDFIDDAGIESLISKKFTYDKDRAFAILSKARELKGLNQEEAAYLLAQDNPGFWEAAFDAAMAVKQGVYGNRIVLFAPVYMSAGCVNDCLYCAFRSSNSGVSREIMNHDRIASNIKALTAAGHKRILAVYAEGPGSDADYIAETMRTVYSVKNGHDEIRRVNVNAAPMFEEEYKTIKSAGIGTFQVFQETYKREFFEKVHGKGNIKSIYDWRLFALHRAQEAGISDVAIGALFGLYNWKYEVLALLAHSADMDREFGVGSHTISFPRLEPALNTPFASNSPYRVSDGDMRRIVAVLRLAVPYTGLILTAREEPSFRRELIKLGVSQTDAGTNIAIGGYSSGAADNSRSQFEISDTRSLDGFIEELVDDGYIPSFCTADYRCGRVGCDFMNLAKSGRIKKLCMPNAVLTFKEYLLDYASPRVRQKGDALLMKYVEDIKKSYSADMARQLETDLERTQAGKRDIYY